ncbi:TadA family conjugal transfer-associated ATPase [Longispora albida]|uniref:TadA family conjugal transfer-associated ATPase n=1 Tax=Longispora albida TaxID=203523 RepID=UPI00037560ED|nr:TadA family conjugal transfer-associated ATPase [Longispora albida]
MSDLTGPLGVLLADERVTDILINGPGEVWVDRGSGLVRGPRLRLGGAAELRAYAQQLAASCGRRLDDASPCVDARLPDGSRLHAVLPPIARRGPYLSLRLYRRQSFGLADLVEPGIAELLSAMVRARLAFLVTGATGSGKTTLLNALLGEVPPTERIVLVEDFAELRPQHPHVVGLETRTSNVEGAGSVGLAQLVREALRMRPDRIVVGEARGAELVDLLAALNTGHEGGAGTLHANAPAEVPARLEALGLHGGLGRAALHAQISGALQVVVHVSRVPEGRAVTEIGLFRAGDDALVVVHPVWARGWGPSTAAPDLARLLAARGVERTPALLTGDAR